MDKKVTIIGFVKEIGANWKAPRVSIVAEDGIYLVTMKAVGKNLFYETGNRVKATGSLSKTREGFRSISVSSYEVFKFQEDYRKEFWCDQEYLNENSAASGGQL